MPIILDIFGVTYTGTINKSLFEITDSYRKQGHKIYLASNVETGKINIFMNDLGLKNHVDGIYCSGSLGVAKPAYGFYHTVTEQINSSPEDVIFFDDSLTNIDGAQAYGWHAHLYTNVAEAKEKIDLFLKDKKREASL